MVTLNGSIVSCVSSASEALKMLCYCGGGVGGIWHLIAVLLALTANLMYKLQALDADCCHS